MIFHEICLLAETFQKLWKILQNLSSAAVMIGALRVNALHATFTLEANNMNPDKTAPLHRSSQIWVHIVSGFKLGPESREK